MARFQSAGLVESRMDFLSCGDATVAILPVGQAPDARFWKYAELIASDGEVDLHSVQAFYQEKQKSPFSNLPWGHGAMRLKFQVDVSSLLRREESNILQDIKQYGNRRRTFGVVGICSCTRCPDVSKAYEEFLEASRMYPNACALRCLMFDPSNDQVGQDHATETHMIMVPPSAGEALGQHVETVMQDFCAVLVMGLEQLALKADACDIPSRRLSFRRASLGGEGEESLQARLASPAGAEGGQHSQPGPAGRGRDLLNSSKEILRRAPELAQGGEAFISRMTANPKDDNAKRLKKRKLASVQRDIGFYCLASGSPVDALRHFSTSVELSQGVADFRVTVAALEGYLCSLLLLKQSYLKNQAVEEDSQMVWKSEELVSIEEILDLILLNLKLASSEDLSIATLIKYARYLSQNIGAPSAQEAGMDALVLKQRAQRRRNLMAEIIQDVREYEGVNMLDTVVLNLELSVLFEELGHFRQQIFSLRKASQTLREMLKAADLRADGPGSSGIQALAFNMIFSHRSEACRKTLAKFKTYLKSEDECTRVRRLYAKKGGSTFAGLACHLEWRDRSRSTRIFAENQSSGSGPFLFSPKSKDKDRELLESNTDRIVWVAGEQSEILLRFHAQHAGGNADVLRQIDISRLRLCFESGATVMTSFASLGTRRIGRQIFLEVKVAVVPLDAGELRMERVLVTETQHGGTVEHKIEFENLKRPLNIMVVKRLPLLAARLVENGSSLCSEIQMYENEQKELSMDLTNIGAAAIRRLEVASTVPDLYDCAGPPLSLDHEIIILEKGGELKSGDSARVKILLSAKEIAGGSSARTLSTQVNFTVLLSETSKEESKFSKTSKTIIRTHNMNITVLVHPGLVLDRVFLPGDDMLRNIGRQGTCVELSNRSSEDLEVCQDLADESDKDAGGESRHLLAKSKRTQKHLLRLPAEDLGDLSLRWRNLHGDRRGQIKLAGMNRISYPCAGRICMMGGDRGKVCTKKATAFEVRVSSQAQQNTSCSFQVKCLREDGSSVSAADAILTGITSFSDLVVTTDAEEESVAKFGAYFLRQGKYTFVLTGKEPDGVLYSERLSVEVS